MYNQEDFFVNCMDSTAIREITLCKNNPIFWGEDEMHPHHVQTLEQHDFVYVLNGSMAVYQDDVEYTAQSDDLLTFQAFHTQWGNKPLEQGLNFMFLHFTTSPLDMLIAPGEEYSLPESCVLFPILLHCKQYPNVKQLFRDIILNSWIENPIQKKRNSALINLLLCEIASVYIASTPRCEALVYDVLQRIQATPGYFYKLDDLAALYGISSRTLSERFKKACGYTIHQYQMHVKLERAYTELTKNCDVKISKIAHDLGFYDEFHFTRMFKREFGYNPTDVRDNPNLMRPDTGFHTPFIGIDV